MDRLHHHGRSPNGDSRWKWALLGFLAVAGFFLWAEHKAHLLGLLPYLLVLACPLLHWFHHRHGHGGHRHDSGSPQQDGDTKTGAPS